jgi:hypothetical protein
MQRDHQVGRCSVIPLGDAHLVAEFAQDPHPAVGRGCVSRP